MKPNRIVTQEGIWILNDATGFYEREDERLYVLPHPYRGLIMITGALLAWALFLGIAYCAWRAVEAISG